MKNIFENVYFGKPYRTRDEKKAIFLRTFVCNGYNYYVSTGESEYSVREDGKVDKNLYPHEEDIISEWQPEINEEELDKMAKSFSSFTDVNRKDVEWIFKTSYRKALEFINRSNYGND